MTDQSPSRRTAVGRRGILALAVAAAVLLPATGSVASTPLFNGLVPTRIVDTRESLPSPTLSSGADLTFHVGEAPVALNLTVTNPTGHGYASIYPCADGFRGTSSINFAAGETVANMSLSVPDVDGNLCVRVVVAGSGTADVVIDQTGWFTPWRGLTPFSLVRAHDSRVPYFFHKLAAGEVIAVSGPAGAGVLMNVTVTEPEAAGHLTVYPCDEPRPTTSTTNYRAGQTKASMTVAVGAADDGEVCIYTHAATHVIVDTSGVISAPPATFGAPARALDTRESGGRGTDFMVSVGNASRAAILNVTAVDPAAAGHVTAYPCGTTPPLASTLNYLTGQTVPNHVVIESDSSGRVCFRSRVDTDLVVDVVGYLD